MFGNHDGWYGHPLRALLQTKGIHALSDEVYRVETRGTAFTILGVGDEEWRKLSARQELSLVPPGAPLLVLTHEPDIFADHDLRVSLTLAGHTHGGQVRLPVIGAPVPHSRYGQRYLRGHIVESGRQLFVTSGIGTSVWPIRLGVPPEYVVLTLR